MRLFSDLFPSLALKETRSARVLTGGGGSLPPNNYTFLELYCDEKGCDCRRVNISVFGENAVKPLAMISMGFDSQGRNAGPFLDPLHPQSEHSRALMDLFLTVVNSDPKYLARLQSHYVLFREKVEGKRYAGKPFEDPAKMKREEKDLEFPSFSKPRPVTQAQHQVGRNAPCPCGSGKKFKKCCLLEPRQALSKTTEMPVAQKPLKVADSEWPPMDRSGNKGREEAEALVKYVVNLWQRKKEGTLTDRHTNRVIEENPLIAHALLRLLVDTYAPDGTMREMSQSYQACLGLIEDALTQIRYSVERNREWAINAAERIQQEMAVIAFKVQVDTRVQADLVRALSEAKLEIHPDIKARSEELAKYYGRFTASRGLPDLNALFDSIAASGPKDPFKLSDQLRVELELLPVEEQLHAMVQMAGARNPLIRELAALMFLHPKEEIRIRLPSFFVELARPEVFSPVALRRMIGLRNWLPEAERTGLDQLIRMVRAAHVECAPMPSVQRVKSYSTPFDGSGAQGVCSIQGKKRNLQLANVLVKQGWGIRDVLWLSHMDKTEVDSILRDLDKSATVGEIEPIYAERALSHFVWVGQQRGNPPPADLLYVAETTNGEYWLPRQVTLEYEIAALEEELDPTSVSAERMERVLRDSAKWPVEERFASSWFEDDSSVDAVMKKVPRISSRSLGALEKARDLILDTVIERSYDIWAERLLWMTLWAKAFKGRSPLPWQDFFIVARQFQQVVPPKKIPLMVAVAERSVASALRRM